MANIVYEDVWEPNDDIIFEQQLKELGDHIINNNLWKDYSVRFFGQSLGLPLLDEQLCKNFCGTGKMLAISYEGKFYPCMRFLESSLPEGKPDLSIGDIYTGINKDKLRRFYALNLLNQSDKECVYCNEANGCSWCSGLNYSCSPTDSIFDRQKFICKMHKANVRANKYFWDKLEKETGIVSPLRINSLANNSRFGKYLYIVTSTDTNSFCQYAYEPSSTKLSQAHLDEQQIISAIEYCEKNKFTPIFLGEVPNKYRYRGLSIIMPPYYEKVNGAFCELINEHNITSTIPTALPPFESPNSIIFKISRTQINKLFSLYIEITKKYNYNVNINFIFEDLHNFTNEDLKLYKHQLELISNNLVSCWTKGYNVEINAITHLLYSRYPNDCGAGKNSFSLCPDGNFYICPAYYFDQSMRKYGQIGNINTGIDDTKLSMIFKNNHICCNCQAKHCQQCSYQSKKYVGEYIVPTEVECIKSHIELQITKSFVKQLLKENIDLTKYPNYMYLDDSIYDPISAVHGNDIVKKYKY